MTAGGGTLMAGERRPSQHGVQSKYVGNGNAQGNLLYISRVQADLSAYGAPRVRDYNFIFKSNVMSALQTNI
jgi:hypothetical protein